MFVRFKGLTAALAASAMVAAPALAAPAPARPLSIAQARAAAPTARGEKIAPGSTATIINVGILAALIVTVLLLTNGGDNGDSAASN